MTCKLKGLSSMATRRVLADLARSFERRAGCGVAIRSMGGVEAARLVRAGEQTDVVVLAAQVMEQLEAEGRLISGSRVEFARSGIAMAVRAGSPRPSASDEQSVKQAMLDAGKICYSTGPSGDHLKQLLERWGVAESISQRTIQAPPGVPVGQIVAQGQADIGFQQFSELIDVPGIEIIGHLPAEIQAVTVFSAAVSRMSSNIEQARALIAHLVSPEAEAAKYRHGMEPA